MSSSRYGESRVAYREVQQRHDDVKKIERTLTELAQLFSDVRFNFPTLNIYPLTKQTKFNRWALWSPNKTKPLTLSRHTQPRRTRTWKMGTWTNPIDANPYPDFWFPSVCKKPTKQSNTLGLPAASAGSVSGSRSPSSLLSLSFWLLPYPSLFHRKTTTITELERSIFFAKFPESVAEGRDGSCAVDLSVSLFRSYCRSTGLSGIFILLSWLVYIRWEWFGSDGGCSLVTCSEFFFPNNLPFFTPVPTRSYHYRF